ncbi:hypothetical protein [Methanobrevibacter arboriphilus]|uniref:Uncharacterized protein n=1 Tax=Methanobrevibacter arboriphilus TaxID=39441 RepID=A0ACA8R5Z0_METAZ|nr:hypothetical protein [Methanobrevibacter arboriphilus]BBL62385.1 hypothetical protein MarbSA_14250 [Methanobrevibacter arboriphilus]
MIKLTKEQEKELIDMANKEIAGMSRFPSCEATSSLIRVGNIFIRINTTDLEHIEDEWDIEPF